MKILSHVPKGQPKLTLINYLRQQGITYPKKINLLRTKHASNVKILQVFDMINNLTQLRNQRTSDFADYVRPRMNHYGWAY